MSGLEKNILVIDNSKLSRMVMEDELKSSGLNVSFATNADEGLLLAYSLDPDFITLELTLEDMSGIELISKLKKSGKTNSVPFMVVTGYEDSIQRELCLGAGAVDVLYKPFSHGELTHIIKGNLDSAETKTGRKILIVEDSSTIRAITKHLLERRGHTVIEAENGLAGLKKLEASFLDIDMIVTDINMPKMDGRQFVTKVRSQQRFQFIPIIVSTTITEKENVRLLLSLGADDYIVKPFASEEFIARIQSHLRTKSLYEELGSANKQLSEFNETLEGRVEERTIELKEANLDAIYSLATAAEAKDDDTGFHVRRIQHYSEALAKKIGLSETQAEEIGYSSIMHDVGKISIPDNILKKPGKLTKEEFDLVKTHSVQGEKILSDKNFFKTARIISRHHHEKWNGEGYPDGLSKENIPLSARIVALADVFDALTSRRPYKEAWPMEKAIEEIKISSGSHFDPGISQAWLALWEAGEVERIFNKWQ
ncbi:MAG TPA: response regulator [Nitrospirae bacterium]|nr:response regulator [Nitrospirota bacterium]